MVAQDELDLVGVEPELGELGAVIVYTAAEWAAFTAGVRGGEFDFA